MWIEMVQIGLRGNGVQNGEDQRGKLFFGHQQFFTPYPDSHGDTLTAA
jgi:hypothetical protein